MDGFDAEDILNKWTVVNSVSGTPTFTNSTRLNAGFAVTLPYGTTGGVYGVMKYFTPSTQVIVGAAIKSGIMLGQNWSPPFHVLTGDSGTTYHLYLVTTPTSALQLWRGDGHAPGSDGNGGRNPNGTMLAATAGGVMDTNWHYVEMSATLNASTGTVVVKVDGTQVINFTGNTKNGGTNTTFDGVGFFAMNFNSFIYTVVVGSPTVDDYYVCNSSGSVNNTFLGDVRVQTLVPNGAGSSTQFAPTGSGTNYLNVNEVPDNTSTYNSSSTVGQRDTYALSDLTATTGQVFGVQQATTAYKPDSGAANLKAAQKSGATVSYGATRSLATGSTTYVDLFETNPATGLAYTPTEVNSLESGAEIA